MRKKDDKRWMAYYNICKWYLDQEDHFDIPENYEINGIKVGKWWVRQKQAYKGNTNSCLSKVQIQLLEKLNISSNSYNSKDSWEKIYKFLKTYYSKYGNINISTKYVTDDGLQISAKLRMYRSSYKKNESYKITKKQIQLLNSLDFDWGPNDTKYLNKEIINNKMYQKILLSRLEHILEDIKYEGFNEINTSIKQKEIEDILIKRLWR